MLLAVLLLHLELLCSWGKRCYGGEELHLAVVLLGREMLRSGGGAAPCGLCWVVLGVVV